MSSKFPSPVGGVLNHDDFTPSLVFAIAYATTIPLVIKSSRSLFIISTAPTTIQRFVASLTIT